MSSSSLIPMDLGIALEFSLYAANTVGGPKKAKQSVLTSPSEYNVWLGDIDPGFSPSHNHLQGVDFTKEILIAIGTGELLLGTTISVETIYLNTAGFMGGQAFVKYTVHHPSGTRIQINGAPYAVVKCNAFSGYGVTYLRTDENK